MRASRLCLACFVVFVIAVLLVDATSAGIFRRRGGAGGGGGYKRPAPQVVHAAPKRERVPNDQLPHDGGKCYLTLFVSPLAGGIGEQELLANFQSHEGLKQLAAQTHCSVIYTDDKLWDTLYGPRIGTTPAVCMTTPFANEQNVAEPIYLARGAEIPLEGDELFQEMCEAIETWHLRHLSDSLIEPAVDTSPRWSSKELFTLASMGAERRPTLFPWNKPKPDDCPDCRPKPDEGIVPPHRPIGRVIVPSVGVKVQPVVKAEHDDPQVYLIAGGLLAVGLAVSYLAFFRRDAGI